MRRGIIGDFVAGLRTRYKTVAGAVLRPATELRRLLDDDNPFILVVHKIEKTRVERILKFLSRRYRFVTPGQFAAELDEGKFDTRHCLLTADDGYETQIRVLTEVAGALDIPALFFLSTGLVGSGEYFWWDRLAAAVDAAAEAGVALRVGGRLYSTRTPAARFATRIELVRSQYDRPLKDIDLFVERVVGENFGEKRKADLPMPPDTRLADWKLIKSVAESPLFKIGSHTVTHSFISQLDAVELDRELRESQQTLTRELGEKPQWFCYPYGSAKIGESAARIIGRYYRAAVTSGRGRVGPQTPRLMLPRIGLEKNDTPSITLAKIQGVWLSLG